MAPVWSFEQLHEDMQLDVGASLRIFARKALVRIDFAVGPALSQPRLTVRGDGKVLWEPHKP